MKRKIEDGEDCDDRESKRKLCGGRGLAGQRSGVVTVGAFKPTPSSPRHSTPAAPAVRTLAQRALSGGDVEGVLEAAKIAGLGPCEAWRHEAEVLATLLYVALVRPSSISTTLVRGAVQDHLDRWLDGDDRSMGGLVCWRGHEGGWVLVLVALLHATLVPDEGLDTPALISLMEAQDATLPPQWLLNAVSCHTGTLQPLFDLLLASVQTLRGQKVTATTRSGYCGSHVSFLWACDMYRRADYGECWDTLHGIAAEGCEEVLQGHILWLKGLCLVRLGKFHAALVKLQAAVDLSDTCLNAIYNISEVFRSLGRKEAQLESLALLFAGRVGGTVEGRLQASLLALHRPTPPGMQVRTQYILAARYLQHKNYKEASNKFLEVSRMCGDERGGVTRTLFEVSDEVPPLPCRESTWAQAAIAHLGHKDHDTALTLLKHMLSDEENLNSEASIDSQMKLIATAVGLLAMVDALAAAKKHLEAIQHCARIEKILNEVRQEDGQKQSKVAELGVVCRACLYGWLSELHRTQGNPTSHRHYLRRARHAASMASSYTPPSNMSDLCPSHTLALENMFTYVKGKQEILSEMNCDKK